MEHTRYTLYFQCRNLSGAPSVGAQPGLLGCPGSLQADSRLAAGRGGAAQGKALELTGKVSAGLRKTENETEKDRALFHSVPTRHASHMVARDPWPLVTWVHICPIIWLVCCSLSSTS